MSKYFKIFLIFLWITSVLLVVFDPFSIVFIGIVNGIFIVIGGLNYLIFRRTEMISLKRDFLLVLLGGISVGLIFYYSNKVNKIILNVKHPQFVLIFNLPEENCVQYESTVTLPESGILFMCNEIEVFDDYSKVVIKGVVNDSAFVSKEVFYSDVYEREIGVVYGGLDYNKALIKKDSLVNHYIRNSAVKK